MLSVQQTLNHGTQEKKKKKQPPSDIQAVLGLELISLGTFNMLHKDLSTFLLFITSVSLYSWPRVGGENH